MGDAVTGDGGDMGVMTRGMEAGVAMDRSSRACVHAWDAGCTVGHSE